MVSAKNNRWFVSTWGKHLHFILAACCQRSAAAHALIRRFQTSGTKIRDKPSKYIMNYYTDIYIYRENIYICVFIIYWFYICSIFLIYLLYELPNGLRHGKCTAHDHCLQNASNVLVYDLWVNFPPFPTTSCLDLPSLTNRPANSRGAHGRTSTLAITASATNFIATRHQQLQPVPLPTLNTCTLPMQASPAT